MKENYTLVLNSQNTTNRIGTGKRNYQYYVNWSAVLPNPQNINQKYSVKFTFTGMSQAAFTDIWSLNIDFGGANVYDQSNSKSNYLGLIYPTFIQGAIGTVAGVVTNTVNYFTRATLSDNAPVTIEYPNNSLITINLININTQSATGFNIDYYLNLEFTPI